MGPSSNGRALGRYPEDAGSIPAGSPYRNQGLQAPVIASLLCHYRHARRHCGCGCMEAAYRAAYAEATGRWPW